MKFLGPYLSLRPGESSIPDSIYALIQVKTVSKGTSHAHTFGRNESLNIRIMKESKNNVASLRVGALVELNLGLSHHFAVIPALSVCNSGWHRFLVKIFS